MTKPNLDRIIVPSGLVPVHSFDVWGVLIDANVLGGRKIDAYKKLAEQTGINPEVIAQNVNDYNALLRGEAWATGERKGAIIDGVEKPLIDAHGKVAIDYTGVFYDDSLTTMRSILDAGEGVIVFSSKPAQWIKENIAPDLAARIGEIYAGAKNKPEAFRTVVEQERALNRYPVSHTADELPELSAALQSGLFSTAGLIYVNRNNSNSEQDVTDAGIRIYVPTLADIQYTSLTKRQ
jgi:hypothetical protein